MKRERTRRQINHEARVSLHRDIKRYIAEYEQRQHDKTGIIVEFIEPEEIVLSSIPWFLQYQAV